MKFSKKQLERISVDRKIVEGLRDGHSVTGLTKSTKKGKGFVIKIRDLALAHGFIIARADGSKLFGPGPKNLPPFPETLFPLKDGRSEKPIEADLFLDPHKKWICERLELGWCPQTVFEELMVSLPKSTFYRYLHRWNLMGIDFFKNVPEIIHAPGECLQVDWGKLADVYNPTTGKTKVVWVFIGTMGHSRYRMVRVVECGDYKTTIAALTSMLEELGGVPWKITSDNPKVFVKKASLYEPTLNPGYERFASYYSFTIEALPPADPRLKGKVERIVNPVRRLFESYDFKTYSLASAQAHIDRKLELHNERKHSTHGLKPLDVLLSDEATVLKPLPNIPYEIETIVYPTIRDDGYVRFENKYYRVDPRLKKETALVIGNSTQVYIYCNGRLLECYEKIQDRFQAKACKDHYREDYEKTLNDHGHYLTRANTIGEDVGRFINIVLARGEGFVDTRVVWGLLTLDKVYESVDINKACRSALELEQVSLGAVRKLLSITATPKAKKPKSQLDTEYRTANGKYARPMSEYKNHLHIVTNNKPKT